VQVLKGVSFEARPGQIYAIVGPSGCGKSTLLYLLGLLDQPDAGTVEIDGQLISNSDDLARTAARGAHIGFVFQFHFLMLEFTALENVMMPLMIRGDSAAKAKPAARELLERVGLGHRLGHKPGELSGGERQRAAVARALVTRPACVLGDEPTGNLDEKTAASVFDLLIELNREIGTALVLVTHDRRLARKLDRTLELTQGRLQPLVEHD
jgi:lipoprotein-releasing system ATP-binding protein